MDAAVADRSSRTVRASVSVDSRAAGGNVTVTGASGTAPPNTTASTARAFTARASRAPSQARAFSARDPIDSRSFACTSVAVIAAPPPSMPSVCGE